MARQRSTGGNEVATPTISAFVELDDDALNEAIAGSRQRGVYDGNILAFIDSGRRGVEVNLADGIHQGKKAASVKTGYESARTKLADGKVAEATDEQVTAAKNMQVVLRGDRVFLVRQDA